MFTVSSAAAASHAAQTSCRAQGKGKDEYSRAVSPGPETFKLLPLSYL